MAMLGAMTSLASAGVGLAGASQQAAAAQSQANYEAELRWAQAKQDVAASQRSAIQGQQQTDVTMSKQIANAAASGGGVDTPGIAAIYGETAGQGDYNSRAAFYTGQQQAWQQNALADAALARGKNAAQGTMLAGIGGAIGGIGKAASSAFGSGGGDSFGTGLSSLFG